MTLAPMPMPQKLLVVQQGRPDPQFVRVCLLIRAVLLMPRWAFPIKLTETYCSNKCQGQQKEAARRPLAR